MARVLLHTCCGICAGHCVSLLQSQGHEVVLFYSNANIAPASEFERRLKAVDTLCAHFGVPVIVDTPNHREWLERVARGFEREPERGARCPRCFRYSLERAAQTARERGFDFFTTTLSVSPHKPSKTIFEIGKSVDAERFLEVDFKKQDGFKKTNTISRSLDLYRQSYCGCEFSLRDALAQRRTATPKTAEMLSDHPEDIALAGSLLRAGGLVAIPTETVYGLAANAFDENAVRSIFSAKGRPFIDPLIVHVHSLEQAETLADTTHPAVEKLAKAFWPGPLTLVLPKKATVPDIVTAGEPTVAVRMPVHPVARKILRAAEVPLAAPSANPFGYVSPTTAQHVLQSLGERLDYIVDGGACDCGIESTIVLVGETVRILRLGVITRKDLEKALGTEFSVEIGKGLLEKKAEEAEMQTAQIAPGMLKKHYSPRAKVELWENAIPNLEDATGKTALVFQKRPGSLPALPENATAFWLSEDGNQATVARSVFALLRRLDDAGFSDIRIERSPNDGIGAAVNDRLSRAAAR